MLKKSHYIILIFVVLLVVALLRLPGGTMGKLKLAISGPFVAFFGAAGATRELTAHAKEALTPRKELQRQNDQLRRQNQEFQILLQQDNQLRSENARLRAEAGWARQQQWKGRLARVIARDPANWWRSLEIDLGARDGVRANLPVLTPEGALAGKVLFVGEARSQVILLGDPNLRVAAKVVTGAPASFETGVVTANSSAPQEDGMIDMDHLSGNSAVRPGQSVETWGGGRRFPGGHPRRQGGGHQLGWISKVMLPCSIRVAAKSGCGLF